MNGEVLISYNLSLTPDQAAKFDAFLVENEFLPGKDGLKEFVLESIELGIEAGGSPIVDAIRNNPEAVKNISDFGLKMAEKLMKKKFKL